MAGTNLFKIACGFIILISIFSGRDSLAQQTSSTKLIEPSISDGKAYREWLVQIHNVGRQKEYLEKSPAYISAYPRATGTAYLMYRQMRSMRRLHKWAEARQKANGIVEKYPKSKIAKRMGGINGLTEDQAALDFAEISKYYHSKQFEPCIVKCEEFLKNYPKNWRRHDLYVYYCYALYHTGQREKLFKVGNRAISKKLVKRKGQIIKFLHAATLIKSGKYDKARTLLDDLEKNAKKPSSLKPEIAKLRFDSYYYENRYDDLARVADAYAEKQTTGTAEWATGKMWTAVARAHQSPPDLEGAANDLDAIIAADVYDATSKEHLPTQALYWRAWVADRQGDKARARNAVKRIRDKMPAGPVRERALSKFSNLLEQKK